MFDMNTEMKRLMSESILAFHLPRYHELPNMGLYLEQTVKYLNSCLAHLDEHAEITPSMVSNYVKKGVIPKPIKKQYYAEHIAYLFFVVFAKNLVSIEEAGLLIEMQRSSYPLDVAYDYMVQEMENVLFYLFGANEALAELGETVSDEKDLFRNLIFSSAHVIYMHACFRHIRAEKQKPE